MYAFGHGLSYVDFEYSDLQANKEKYRANDVIKLTFNLTNNGSMEADEVTQVYVKRLDATIEWPVKELSIPASNGGCWSDTAGNCGDSC